MRITANIATYPPRMHSLKQVVASLYDQVDEIRICFNGMEFHEIPTMISDLEYRDYENDGKIKLYFPEDNLTDNGKFQGLDELIIPEYYLTCDDDIIYPPDYVETTIENIKKFGGIVSYHGRILKKISTNYYLDDHKSFSMFREVKLDLKIDVCSTGVMAFSTEYFHPKGLASHNLQKMSDLIFALEAAKQKKTIGCCKHKTGWLKPIMHEENIYDLAKEKTPNQNELANQIFTLNHG